MRLKMMEKARRDNFLIGESGATNSRTVHTIQSSSRDAFDPMVLNQASHGEGRNGCMQNAKEFKQANFKFWGTTNDYQTTSKDTHKFNGPQQTNKVTNAMVQK